MAVNSKAKGARFERLLASKFREYGFDCRRGQQYCGANGDADVIGLYGVHIEAKHVEKLNIHDAMSQAKHDASACGKGDFPAVFHKRNNTEILVTVQFDTFMKLYKEWWENNAVE